ncbi:MAG: 5'-nucleotidase C-terminal domain-containing protein, partial [Oscillospiraceae bacterium]|nr:5'-nucleotidase C-terminal domain-containing protein [Oscillospiraceae bacterium]
AEYVKNVFEAGLMNGVKDDQFNPEGTSTRAQIVTVLYRVAGQPPVGAPATFTDLVADWYANPVAWAQKTGVVNGLTPTTFGPNKNVTREQLVTMIWRYYGEPKGTGDLSTFPDADKVSGYARDAFAWAIGEGVINGSNGKLNPQGNATRAQFAKIIWVAREVMTPEPCDHVWDNGVVTTEPTCGVNGVKTFTCTECGETKTETVPATGEHNYDGQFCTVCGAEDPNYVPPTSIPDPGPEYTLTAGLKNGDKVVIYNAGSGKAMSSTKPGYYLAGVDLTVVDNVITTEDTTVIWTVRVNDDGSYSFLQNDTELSADTSVNGDKTYTNIHVQNGLNGNWELIVCNAENSSFYIANTGIDAKYEKVYLEWYGKQSGFSAYDTSADRLNETEFGFQFFALDAEKPCDHAWDEGKVTTEATCEADGVMTFTCTICGATKTEVIPAPGHNMVDGECTVCHYRPDNTTYARVNEIKEGDEIIIVCATRNVALSGIYGGYNNNGTPVTPVDDVITTDDSTIVWTVGKEGDFYTFTYDGKMIAMGTGYTSMPLGEVNYKWQLQPAANEGTFYLVNLDREPGKAYYMQWYEEKNYWSAYHTLNDDLMALAFYANTENPNPPCEHAWDEGVVTTEPTCKDEGVKTFTCTKCGATKTESVPPTGEHTIEGDTCTGCGMKITVPVEGYMAIYNVASGMIMTTESSVYNNKNQYMSAAATLNEENKLETEALNAAIFKIETDENGITTFTTTSGKYLEADGKNINIVDEKTENCEFVLEPVEGGYYIRLANYVFTDSAGNAKPQYIEYYTSKGVFTVYGMGTDTSMYVFNFYELAQTEVPAEETGVILFTNDVHTYINKELSYADIAALKEELTAAGTDVILVDAGDHVQGTAFGSMDKGETIIKLMNAAGYDAATMGNHEFDYGMERALELVGMAQYPYLSANFYHEKDGVRGENVLESFKIFEMGGKKVAIIGLTTPETYTKSTPKYFMDENGNYIYGIAGGDDGAALYADAQAAIDAAKAAGADYVIALGHLGDDPASMPWTSEELIANVTGLDAFIDGHSHSTVERKEVTDKDGNVVVLAQTGQYFDAIGKMTISEDGIAVELVKAVATANETVAAMEAAWIEEVNDLLGEVIAKNEVDFRIKDNDGTRLIRKQETNLGDFCADALFYLFDVTEGLDADLAIMNGGGIRADMPVGDVSYLTTKTVHTFGNVACLIEVSGQQILDALEWGAKNVGVGENGGFLHVSNVTYKINSAIPSTVQIDAEGLWAGAPTGAYRVSDVKIGGEALDLAKTYRLAGYNYTLRDLGDGFNMFGGAVNVKDYVMEDYMVLANYAKSFPEATIKADNSPLGVNYGSIYGEGRITIVNEPVDCVEHQWNAGEVTTPATCVAEGVMTYTCTVCGETKTEAIPATGEHTYENGVCTGCGEEEEIVSGELTTGQYVIAAKVGETYYAMSNTFAAKITGTEIAVTNGTVANAEGFVIDLTQVEGGWTISANGTYLTYVSGTNLGTSADPYVWVIGEGVKGTYRVGASTADTRGLVFRTQDSSKQYFQFGGYSVNNIKPEKEEYFDVELLRVGEGGGNVQPPVEPCTHEWNEGKVTTAATCAVEGVMTYTCNLCGETKTEAIPATNEHVYENGTCTGCGKEDPDNNQEPDPNPTELTEGQYVIAAYVDGKYYAMTNVFSSKITGVEITVTDGKVAAADATNYAVTLATSGTGWTIKGAEGYLAWEKSTNFVTAADPYVWNISAGATAGLWSIVASTTVGQSTVRALLFQTEESRNRFGPYSISNIGENYAEVMLLPVV